MTKQNSYVIIKENRKDQDVNKFELSYVTEQEKDTFTILDFKLPTIDSLREDLGTNRKRQVLYVWKAYINHEVYATYRKPDIRIHKIPTLSALTVELGKIPAIKYNMLTTLPDEQDKYTIHFTVGKPIQIAYLPILQEGLQLSVHNYRKIIEKYKNQIILEEL